jgi:hypothetical protein
MTPIPTPEPHRLVLLLILVITDSRHYILKTIC